jgi:hypothetical protein
MRMQVEKGGGGWTSWFAPKMLTLVILITDLVPPLTKAQRSFISAIPNGFQIADKKTRRRSKNAID